MRLLPLFFALPLALAAAGCTRPVPPQITPESVRITAVTPLGVDVEARFSAFNPNATDISARQVEGKVTLDGKHDLGTVTAPGAIDLPAGKTTKVTVPMSVKWNDLATVATLAASSRDVPYQVDGTVQLGGDLLHVGVPFHLAGTITHDQLVQAALTSLPKLKIPGLTIPGH